MAKKKTMSEILLAKQIKDKIAAGKKAHKKYVELAKAVQKLATERDAAEELSYEMQDQAETLEGKLKYAKYIVPPKGKFIGYKKVFVDLDDGVTLDCVATLEVPAKAKRITPDAHYNTDGDNGEYKSRVCHAKVLKIECEGGYARKMARSQHDSKFLYHVGKIVKPKKAFHQGDKVCASGIHLFTCKQKAWDY